MTAMKAALRTLIKVRKIRSAFSADLKFYSKLIPHDPDFGRPLAIRAVLINLRKLPVQIQPSDVCREGVAALDAKHFHLLISKPMKNMQI